MSLQSAIEFVDRVQSDIYLSNTINEVVSNSWGKVKKFEFIASIADSMGYEFTLDEWEEALLMPVNELDEDELLNVAGGMHKPDRSRLRCKGFGMQI